MIKKKLQKASIVSAAILCIGPLPAAKSADGVVEQTTVMTACKLFGIDSNAGLLTAAQRVQIIQSRLDSALIRATDLTPSAVKISIVNNNPVVSLDTYMIATADGNSATRNSMTKMQVAERWADSLRMCLADSASIQRYISMLTGKFPGTEEVAGAMMRDEIAILNPETLLPVKLLTPISTESSHVGDPVQAVVSTDVPLRPFFSSYLPAGTLAIGEIVSAHRYTVNDFAGKNAITVNFYKLRTPDGQEVPIDGHILGGVDDWTMIHARPTTAVSCLDGPQHATALYPDMIDHVMPSKGYIVGAWKGVSFDETREDNYPRLIFTRDSGTVVSRGEPMLLRLTASTAMALSGKRKFVSVMADTH